MAPPRKKGREIEIDPDLVRAGSQPLGSRPRLGTSTPRSKLASAAVQANDGTPGRLSGAPTPRRQLGSVPRRRNPAIKNEIDPDLVASAPQLVHATPDRPAGAPMRSSASLAYTPRPQQTPASTVSHAGRFSTPAGLTKKSAFSSTPRRGRPTPQNTLGIDDIETSSPETKGRFTDKLNPRDAQVSRPASTASRQHNDRYAPNPKRQRVSPSPIGSRPLQALDAMNIDHDSIHSSSPPERIPESTDGDSQEEAADQDTLGPMDVDSSDDPESRELSDSGDEDSSDEPQQREVIGCMDEPRDQEMDVKVKREESPGLTLPGRPQSLKPAKSTLQNGRQKPRDRPQFLSAPKYLPAKPREGPQFLPAPRFVFKPPAASEGSAPNPRKYTFKEDRPARPPAQEPDPEPKPDPAMEVEPVESKRARARAPLRCVRGGLAHALQSNMSRLHHEASEGLAAVQAGRALVEVDEARGGGAGKSGFWMVRGRAWANGRVVCLLLPAGGRAVKVQAETEGRCVETGSVVELRGARWSVRLEGVEWTVVPDWLLVREEEPEKEVVRRDVVYGSGWVAYTVSPKKR